MEANTHKAVKHFFDQIFDLNSTGGGFWGGGAGLGLVKQTEFAALGAASSLQSSRIIKESALELYQAMTAHTDQKNVTVKANALEGAILVGITGEQLNEQQGYKLIDELHDLTEKMKLWH